MGPQHWPELHHCPRHFTASLHKTAIFQIISASLTPLPLSTAPLHTKSGLLLGGKRASLGEELSHPPHTRHANRGVSLPTPLLLSQHCPSPFSSPIKFLLLTFKHAQVSPISSTPLPQVLPVLFALLFQARLVYSDYTQCHRIHSLFTLI